jgi:tRNA threonylcarbamoyladenosine biosynthesis protein TsaB
MIICLETATNICSVALCDSAGVISLRESNDSRSHASLLTILIGDILKENRIEAENLDAIAVSKGPGSYTGLRIGVSVAKGIAYAASLPLIGIDTTLVMFSGIDRKKYDSSGRGNNTLYCPMLDARRMEVYNAIYDSGGKLVKSISADVINEESFSYIPESTPIVFFGDGSAKCKNVIKRANAVFDVDFKISASYMCSQANKAFIDRNFADVAYFEPFYLKDFITTQPRKNITGI